MSGRLESPRCGLSACRTTRSVPLYLARLGTTVRVQIGGYLRPGWSQLKSLGAIGLQDWHVTCGCRKPAPPGQMRHPDVGNSAPRLALGWQVRPRRACDDLRLVGRPHRTLKQAAPLCPTVSLTWTISGSSAVTAPEA